MLLSFVFCASRCHTVASSRNVLAVLSRHSFAELPEAERLESRTLSYTAAVRCHSLTASGVARAPVIDSVFFMTSLCQKQSLGSCGANDISWR